MATIAVDALVDDWKLFGGVGVRRLLQLGYERISIVNSEASHVIRVIGLPCNNPLHCHGCEVFTLG